MTAVVDAVVGGINHNLRKKLDVELYRSVIISHIVPVSSDLARVLTSRSTVLASAF